MRCLYFDCFAGASGNMILGALIALGINEKEFLEQLCLLDIADFNIEFSVKNKAGVSAIYVEVKVPDEKAHRHFYQIEKIINDSRLSKNVKTRAIKIFQKLAVAEAKIHGIEVEKVHFHEVGAMDAIIDIVGACIGFELLGIEKFVCSKIHVGSGFVKMAHGKYPIPPPAVAEILQGKPIYSTEIEGELITPTGAAIISTICDEFGKIPKMTIEKTSYGAGSRDYKEFPNVLRLILGETEDFTSNPDYESNIKNQLILIETNIDDLSPQNFGFVMNRAFEIGALDCWFTPIQMKKNRPATKISILCDKEKREVLTELIYTETTTLGVRVTKIERECLPREVIKIETEFGKIDVKITRYKNKTLNIKPEYDQMRDIALKLNLPLREVEKKILEQIKNFESEISLAATNKVAR